MKRPLTFREFLALLPLTGWTLENGKIVRTESDPLGGVCPWVYVSRLSNVATSYRNCDCRVLWAAADNLTHSGLFRPTLRKKLLAACGLTEDGRQLYGDQK